MTMAGALRHQRDGTKGALDHASERSRAAAKRPWVEKMGRFGLVGLGSAYLMVGGIALQIAMRPRSDRGPRGALAAVADEVPGKILLIVLAAGLASYAAWLLVQAIIGEHVEDDGGVHGMARLSTAFSGLVYAVIASGAVMLVVRGGNGAGSGSEQRRAATIMDAAWGRWLVGAIGVAIAIAAIVTARQALKRTFMRPLKGRKMSGDEKRWLARLGSFGFLARSVVFTLICVFLVRAAVTYDPKDAVGLDGALLRLARAPYGPYMLSIVAAGLVAYGVYRLFESRFRRV